MRRLFFLPLFLLASFAHAAEDQASVVFNFSGGVDFTNICTEVAETRGCDQANLVSNQIGGLERRGGSERFISQRISSEPINSLYTAYITTNSSVIRAVYATTADSIYVSTSDSPRQWVAIKSGLRTHNQKFSFATVQNKVLMTGDALTDPIFQHDVIASSFSAFLTGVKADTGTVIIHAKYLLWNKNYLLAANVKDVTEHLAAGATFYPTRAYFSILNKPSSMTALRFIEFGDQEGRQITGLSEKFGNVQAYTQSGIDELAFTALNINGDQEVTPLVRGAGLYAPGTLSNVGLYDIIQTNRGLILWDGARRQRLTVDEESKTISQLVRPVLEKIIRRGTYSNAHGIHYGKRNWYVYAYEDPDRFPRGVPNSVLIFDLNNGEWYPIKNWIASSFSQFDGPGDTGSLIYGDNEGYVYIADKKTLSNDARKEFLIDPMDKTTNWTGATVNNAQVLEGTASLRMTFSAQESSMTRLGIINVGEWSDRTKVTTSDKIQFKVYPSSLGNIMQLRVDLLFENNPSSFTHNFSSVTLSTSVLTAGNTAWSTVELDISSFPINPAWLEIQNEQVPFPKSLTYFGLRFYSTSTADASLSFDDVCVIQKSENPLNAFRTTKHFDLGVPNEKKYAQVLLTRGRADNSAFYVDAIVDFGKSVNTVTQGEALPNEIFAYNKDDTYSVTKLDSISYAVKDATASANIDAFDFLQGSSDKDYIFAADRTNDKLFRVDRTSMNRVATYGSMGSGTTNFATIHQVVTDPKTNEIAVVDTDNNRIKIHARTGNMAFKRQYGTLGSGTTSLFEPTGITWDDNNIWIADNGNGKILKVDRSSFGFVSAIQWDQNTFGEATMASDELHYFLAYNRLADNQSFFQEIVLEKRLKSDDSVLARVFVRPSDDVGVSTYSIRGNLSRLGKHLLIAFTDDVNQNGRYYIQKRLTEDLSVVSEFSTRNIFYGVSGNDAIAEPYIKSEAIDLGSNQGRYLQLRYYENDQLDNDFSLFSQSIIFEPVPYRRH